MTSKQAAEWQGKSKEKKWQLILEQARESCKALHHLFFCFVHMGSLIPLAEVHIIMGSLYIAFCCIWLPHLFAMLNFYKCIILAVLVACLGSLTPSSITDLNSLLLFFPFRQRHKLGSCASSTLSSLSAMPSQS